MAGAFVVGPPHKETHLRKHQNGELKFFAIETKEKIQIHAAEV